MSASLKTHLAMDARHQTQLQIDGENSNYWQVTAADEKKKMTRRIGRPLFNHFVYLLNESWNPDTFRQWADLLRKVNDFILCSPIDEVWTAEKLVAASQSRASIANNVNHATSVQRERP